MTVLNSIFCFFRRREPQKVNKWYCRNMDLADLLGNGVKTTGVPDVDKAVRTLFRMLKY